MLHDIFVIVVSAIFIIIAVSVAWIAKKVDQLVRILTKFLKKERGDSND